MPGCDISLGLHSMPDAGYHPEPAFPSSLVLPDFYPNFKADISSLISYDGGFEFNIEESHTYIAFDPIDALFEQPEYFLI